MPDDPITAAAANVTAAKAPKTAKATANAFDRHLIHYGFEFYSALIESASGAVVRDVDGREILDFTSGQMCATLGHNHPAVVAAVERACRSVLHLYSGMVAVPVVRLAEALADMLPAGLQRMMFLSTGGESNEAALRMAKLHTGRFEVLGLTGSWHGMTAGAASSTYAAGRRGYGPSLPGAMALPAPNCYRCPVQHCRETCDLACLEIGFAMFDSQSVGEGAAVIAEPVLSSAGVVVPPENYFRRLKEMCRARGMLLIMDEAQTAFGRLGADFAFQLYGVEPDMLTLSKTLGAGLPIAATVTGDAIEADCREKGFMHVTSHVSDPLAAEVGCAVLETLAAERINQRALEMGSYLRAGLEELQSRHEPIGDVRGAGLLLGVDLVKDRETREPDAALGGAVTRRCMELGLSMNIVGVGGLAAVWRVAPPPVITREQIDRGVAILDQALTECRGAA